MCNGNTKKRREKRIEKIFEIITTENFSNLLSDMKPQIQEAQGTPTRKMTEKLPLGMLILNYRVSKIKKKILKEATGRNTLSI